MGLARTFRFRTSATRCRERSFAVRLSGIGTGSDQQCGGYLQADTELSAQPGSCLFWSIAPVLHRARVASHEKATTALPKCVVLSAALASAAKTAFSDRAAHAATQFAASAV